MKALRFYVEAYNLNSGFVWLCEPFLFSSPQRFPAHFNQETVLHAHIIHLFEMNYLFIKRNSKLVRNKFIFSTCSHTKKKFATMDVQTKGLIKIKLFLLQMYRFVFFVLGIYDFLK